MSGNVWNLPSSCLSLPTLSHLFSPPQHPSQLLLLPISQLLHSLTSSTSIPFLAHHIHLPSLLSPCPFSSLSPIQLLIQSPKTFFFPFLSTPYFHYPRHPLTRFLLSPHAPLTLFRPTVLPYPAASFILPPATV